MALAFYTCVQGDVNELHWDVERNGEENDHHDRSSLTA